MLLSLLAARPHQQVHIEFAWPMWTLSRRLGTPSQFLSWLTHGAQAGYGAKASTLAEMAENRGVAFDIGGELPLISHITIPGHTSFPLCNDFSDSSNDKSNHRWRLVGFF